MGHFFRSSCYTELDQLSSIPFLSSSVAGTTLTMITRENTGVDEPGRLVGGEHVGMSSGMSWSQVVGKGQAEPWAVASTLVGELEAWTVLGMVTGEAH